MGNKAVLNITKFSLGDSTSMAALLLPTTRPDQDVSDYSVADDLMVENAVEEFCKGYSGTGSRSANAVFGFLNTIDPTFLAREFSGFSDLKDKLTDYSNLCSLYGFYSLVNDWLYVISEMVAATYDCNPRSVGVATLRAKVEEQQPYDTSSPMFNGIKEFYLGCMSRILASPVFADECEDEELDALAELVHGMIDAFETGTEDFAGFDAMRNDKRGTETKFSEFYTIVSCLGRTEESDKIADAFETLRLRANGVLLRRYVNDAIEYPYFLDLSMNDPTQTDSDSDADGSTMHTLEREVSKGDGWESNHQKGDRLRIRDMFRVDKLNKVSAYESFVLSPGHYGLQKDLEMEQEDMVSRLMQDELNVYGVAGIANTSAGLYLLTEPDDSSSMSSKSTAFKDAIGVYDTGTFKNFVVPLDQAENYLEVSHISPRVGLLRHFGGKSTVYSSGSEFLSWYSSYADSVVSKRGEVQGKASLLRIIADNCYEWFPSKLGVKYIEGIYGQTEYDGDEFREVSRKLPSGGLSIIASIGDDNYEQSVPRCFDIEVPCDVNSQYSYLTFGCELVVDSDLPTAAREVSIEFSLDDAAPIRFFLVNNEKKPENISETNPLYESVKQYDPDLNKPQRISSMNNETQFKFVVENNLATEESRTFHIAITATYPALRDIISSEELKRAYANTFVRISAPSLPIQNRKSQITYGDYHSFMAKRGESIDDFWNLSATMDKASHQHILEVPHNIRMANNSVVPSNYTTASLFSDVLTAKNHMDSEYRMQVGDAESNFLVDRFRHYTGIDSCSDTVSLYYDADIHSVAEISKDNSDENLAQEYEVVSEVAREDVDDPQIGRLKYKRIETIKAINRFQHDMKHKSNLFSVRVRNSMTNEMLAEAQAKYKNSRKTDKDEAELMETEQAVKNVRTLITSAIEKICLNYAPAHNQLFKVYFD